MSRAPLVPPLKCQGIKTKLVPTIQRIVNTRRYERWVEPFCGSCVVALNIQPKKALLCDTNVHIIRLYREIQNHVITPASVKAFLDEDGEKLKIQGEPYYYSVRDRFNDGPNSLDFLFLNRSCFNGIMRFNRRGKFNVPYCHKPERFARAYVTKITNQVRQIAQVLDTVDWTFEVSDFRETLLKIKTGDLVYADPPYAGRHVDYFNSWSDSDEDTLASKLSALHCDFILSTWHGNEFRKNLDIERIWGGSDFCVTTLKHFYHVGSSENLRHPMIEAVISNFPFNEGKVECEKAEQSQLSFMPDSP